MATAATTLTKQDLDRLGSEFEAAIARGDAAAIASFYAEDAVLMPPGSEAIHGRQAIEQFWRAALEQLGIKAATITTLEVMAAGDLACEVGAATLRIQSPEGQVTDAPAKYLVAWRRQPDGAWRLAADIWNGNTPT